MGVKLNIYAFLKRFNEEYNLLYESNDAVEEFQDAVEAFDEALVEHPAFIAEFSKVRGDLISSDREAAAFTFAFRSMTS